ncbi:hypothetical protein JRQ81_005958 [Phrynocephalus forsythii]|uniref:Uncharacterized protein n=1 Tax=Phrynocephalus forsythii TaxID=171643 RepID=A0A9Q0XIT3_9SAUR|nr:hypothetical protein JRQ81_005958 [Phrynocephalus forsythii]
MTNPNEHGTIQMDGTDLPRTEKFKYLGSTITDNGNLSHKVILRMNSAWLKWHATSSIMCDKKISDCLKSKIFYIIVRPVALLWCRLQSAVHQLKKTERCLGVTETKMWR